jgi:tetratricopeptide (TPR) repeat protein
MSYINEALRKAQRERDNRYEQFGGIIAACPGGADRLRKRRVVLFAAALIVLVSTALLLAVQVLHQPPLAKNAPQSSVAGTAAPPAAATSSAPKAAGSDKAAVPDGDSWAAVRTGAAAAAFSAAVQPPGGTQTVREADARYGEALLAQRKGDLKRAEALYQKVLTFDPDHVRALNNLGVVYMAQKKREKAIAVLGRAVVLKKDYVDPYYNLACLYAQANEISESLWYLKVAAKIDGDVLNWVKKDADMKNVAASPEFKKIMEGQKN